MTHQQMEDPRDETKVLKRGTLNSLRQGYIQDLAIRFGVDEQDILERIRRGDDTDSIANEICIGDPRWSPFREALKAMIEYKRAQLEG